MGSPCCSSGHIDPSKEIGGNPTITMESECGWANVSIGSLANVDQAFRGIVVEFFLGVCCVFHGFIVMWFLIKYGIVSEIISFKIIHRILNLFRFVENFIDLIIVQTISIHFI
jgi:hypothetical protein